jgi:hypothetical protein
LGITVGLAMLFLAALLWGLQKTSPVHADPGTLYVDGITGQDINTCGTTAGPCQTISYTLNSRAGEGDTILIAEGTYTENLTITGITVTLRGGYAISGTQWLTDTGETVVDGNDAGRVFFIHGSNSVLENLTITGGDAPPLEAWGGGLWVTDGDVTIRSSTITGNGDADWSMGVEVNDDYGPAHLTLVSSTVGHNTGNGLHLYGGGASAEVRDTTFTGNVASNGGGILIEHGSSAAINSSCIISNAATGVGGGIAVADGSSAVISNSRILSNTANAGGGLFTMGVTVTVHSNDFLSNTSQADEGPAIWAGSSVLAIDGNLIAHNVSNAAWVGGAVRLHQLTTTLTNNIVVQNQASGFQVTESSVAFVNNTIVTNTLDGIGVWDNSTVPLLRNNIIADNGAFGVAGDGIVSLSEYNDLWNNPNGSYDGALTVTLGAGNIALDPQFVDAPNGNYHLQAGSPCIDAGTSAGAPIVDFDGDSRPLDGNLDGTPVVDIGADEFKPYQIYLPLTLKNVGP